MAVGWAKDGSDQEEAASVINQGVLAARQSVYKSKAFCSNCTGIIFRSHRAQYPDTTLCHKCHKD